MRSILLFLLTTLFSPVFSQSFTSWITGDTSDVEVSGIQPGIVLAGGGGDSDPAMSWMLQRAAGGDVLVLRASGSDGYNDYLYSELGVTVHSVETIRFESAAAANDPYVLRRLEEAELLFFAGGDQYDYYQFFKDNAVEDAIHYLIQEKGITIGGTSAGMAILGEAYYTPSSLGIYSSEALSDPFHPYMDILGFEDFLSVPYLEETVTDTHFEQRDRQGRLITFLARLTQDHGIRSKGIAANEYTAVCVDENGVARCFGEYPQYPEDQIFFAQVNCSSPIGPETCESGVPLHWVRAQQAVKVYRVPATPEGDYTFDLTDWETGSGGIWLDWYVDDGDWMEVSGAVMPDCSGFSGLDQVDASGIRIFPNPVKDRLFLQLPDHWSVQQLELIDVNGRIVRTFSITERSLSLAGLAPGGYVLVVSSANGPYHHLVQILP